MKKTNSLLLLSLSLTALPATRARSAETEGPSLAGLSATRRVLPSGPRPPVPVSVGAASGYGYTEEVLGLGDTHHRILGTLTVEGAPLDWLGIGLRLDGRYDRHAFSTAPKDDGWTGEPRLFVRADRSVSPEVSLGARASVWLPGSTAPSLVPGAATTDLLGMFTYAKEAFALHVNAGYRLDRSAESASDASMLGPGDRLALNVSGFDAALLGLGVSYRRPGWELFGEWSWDMLLGEGAPSASASPMRVGVGTRAQLSQLVTFEVVGEVSPSSRPTMSAMSPLVPVPARFGVMAGLLFAFGGSSAPPAPLDEDTKPIDDPRPALAPASLEGAIAFDGVLPADARLVLRRGDDEQSLTPDPSGRFAVPDLAPGPAEVIVSAEGYETASTQVNLQPGATLKVSLALKRRLPSGQIRGTIRSFGGKAVVATVRVASDAAATAAPGETAGPWEVRSQEGRFQLDVPPGKYSVTIEAPGYDTQTRTVEVELNGVTVLNADMRESR